MRGGERRRRGGQYTGKSRDGVLSWRYLWQDSEREDLFTGQTRPISNLRDYEWSVGFRHDITALELAYGFDLEKAGAKTSRDIDLYDRYSSITQLSAFLEVRLWQDVTLRLEANNVLEDDFTRHRVRGFFPSEQIFRLERLDEREVMKFAVSVQGNF